MSRISLRPKASCIDIQYSLGPFTHERFVTTSGKYRSRELHRFVELHDKSYTVFVLSLQHSKVSTIEHLRPVRQLPFCIDNRPQTDETQTMEGWYTFEYLRSRIQTYNRDKERARDMMKTPRSGRTIITFRNHTLPP